MFILKLQSFIFFFISLSGLKQLNVVWFAALIKKIKDKVQLINQNVFVIKIKSFDAKYYQVIQIFFWDRVQEI